MADKPITAQVPVQADPGQPAKPVPSSPDAPVAVDPMAQLMAAVRPKSAKTKSKTKSPADPARQSPEPASSPEPGPAAGDGGALSAGTPGDSATPATPDPADASAALETPGPDDSGAPETNQDQAQEHDQDLETARPELPKNVQKRIDKLVAQKKSAEEALAKAQAELDQAHQAAAQAPASPLAPLDVARPWASAPEVAAVEAREAKLADTAKLAKNMLRRLDREPEAVLAELDKLGVPAPDSDAARGWLEDVADKVSDQLDSTRAQKAVVEDRARASHQAAEQASMVRAHKDFPWMNDRTSPEFNQAVQFVGLCPAIRANPHWRELVGFAIEGAKVVRSRAQAAAPTPPRPRPAPAPAPAPGGGARPGGAPTEVAARASALKAHTSAPSLASLASVLKSVLPSPRSRDDD